MVPEFQSALWNSRLGTVHKENAMDGLVWLGSARYVNDEGCCVHSSGEGGALRGRCWTLFLKQGCLTKYLAWVINLCLSLFQDIHMLEN